MMVAVTMPMSAEQIAAAVDGEISIEPPRSDEPIRYLGRTEVAHYLGLAGLASLTGVALPPEDAMVGDRKGWLPATIDEWNAKRPGRGRWGPRD